MTELATVERTKRGRMEVVSADNKVGGEWMQVDRWAGLLEFMADQNLLGPEQDATRRYEAGSAYQRLYWRTHASKGVFNASGGIRSVDKDGDIGNHADVLQTRWIAIGKALGPRMSQNLYELLIDDYEISHMTSDFYRLLCRMRAKSWFMALDKLTDLI